MSGVVLLSVGGSEQQLTTGVSPPPHVLAGLWACPSECKILGHSDRCWSPSAVRANPLMPPPSPARSPAPAPALGLAQTLSPAPVLALPPPALSSFSGGGGGGLQLPKTASLPRDAQRRDHYYQAQLPKTLGLQSVYEKVLHSEYDYVLVTPPRNAPPPPCPAPPTAAAAAAVMVGRGHQEIGDIISIPVYKPSPPPRCPASSEDV